MKNNRTTRSDMIIEGLCLIMLIGTTIYLIVRWQCFPKQVPMHSNFAGEVDRWGKRSEMLILPIVSWVMYVFLTVIGRFPQVWNTGVQVTEENRERVYRILKNMLGTLKVIVIALFVCMTVSTSMAASLPGWFMTAAIVVVFGDLIFWLVMLYRNR